MTKEEFLILAKSINKMWDKCIEDSYVFELWFAALEEYSYEECRDALKIYMKSSAYSPKPADLIKYIQKATEIDYPTASEAWSHIALALRNSIYNSQDEFDQLNELEKRAVGSARNLKEMAMSSDFNEGVESSNFKRVYNELVNRQKERDKIFPGRRIELEKKDEMKRLGNG